MRQLLIVTAFLSWESYKMKIEEEKRLKEIENVDISEWEKDRKMLKLKMMHLSTLKQLFIR